jgi:hypothetical protein
MLAVTSYMACVMFIKLSLLYLYKRISTPGNRRFSIAWWITAFVVIGYTIPSLLATIFQCRPVKAAWDFRFVEPNNCIHVGNLYVSHAVLNAITDVIFLLLPIPSVWALSITMREKITISLLFALGSLSVYLSHIMFKTVIYDSHAYTMSSTCVVSIIRLTQLIAQIHAPFSDWTTEAMDGSIWSYVPVKFSIILSISYETKSSLDCILVQ